MVTLTDEQQSAVDKAVKSLSDRKEVFRIGGYAGTGKTTIARWITDEVPGAMVCSFTGKAACRLREKGLDEAVTIHSTIYRYDENAKKFFLKPVVEGDYFLIDEASMIYEELWRDILSFGKPIILIGDPGQLEPIGKDPGLMKDPDVVLDKIHRQAEGSGILTFAEDIRLGRFDTNDLYRDVTIRHNVKPTKEDVLWADVVLCGFNRSRHKINRYYRDLNEIDGFVQPGERVICLQNSRDLGVFNGQILDVVKVVREDPFKLMVRENGDTEDTRILPFSKMAFGKQIPKEMRGIKSRVIADWAYAITCHKSQGSEWDKVVVIDQQCVRAWDPARWRYTAITRAAKELRYYFV